jgi:hypothetical protein
MKRRAYRKEREDAARIKAERAKLDAAVEKLEQERRAIRERMARAERAADRLHIDGNYYIYKKGRITDKKELGVWHHEGNTVFVRCMGCFAILKIDWGDIREDGITNECIVCANRACRAHMYIKFEGFWNK